MPNVHNAQGLTKDTIKQAVAEPPNSKESQSLGWIFPQQATQMASKVLLTGDDSD